MLTHIAVLAQTSIPEPDLGSLAATLLSALSAKNYTLLASVVVVALVWALRTFGVKLLPVLGTPRGGAVLSVVGGTASLLVAALASGQSFSVGLLFGCINAALAASGLWSLGKNLAKKPSPVATLDDETTPVIPQAQPICSAADIANKKPGCV